MWKLCNTNTHVERFWRRSEMKHIMKILECVVSYQSIRIAFLRLHRRPVLRSSSPPQTTHGESLSHFSNRRELFLCTHTTRFASFSLFSSLGNSSRKIYRFYFLSLACCAVHAELISKATRRWIRRRATWGGGRIEERFIIIFIAFQTEICELHRRENKNRSTMIRFLPITRLFPSLLSSCRRTGKSWGERTRRDNDMEEMNDCLRLNLMKNNMNNREGGWAVGESAASRCSMF